jgi:glycosyltransferase involved in cell wall biosynthesis
MMNDSQQPKVSVVIPTKNRRELLRETLASVMTQSYPNWEAIVVDDGSNDGTEELVKATAFADQRVRFVRRERKPPGAPTCRNIGLSLASGDYVIYLDSDDLLGTSCLERRIEIMKLNPKVDFAVFQSRVFRSVPGDTHFFWNMFTAENDVDRFLRTDVPWQTAGSIWLKKSLLRLGPWDERALSWQDWEFHIRAIISGLNYIRVPEADSFWRAVAPGSISHSANSKRRVFNRVRLLKNLALFLESKHEMTAYRRRVLEIIFFRHAFASGLSLTRGVKIWRVARQVKLPGLYRFLSVLLWQLLARIASRINRWLGRRYPDYHLIGSNTRWIAVCLEGAEPQQTQVRLGSGVGCRLTPQQVSQVILQEKAVSASPGKQNAFESSDTDN